MGQRHISDHLRLIGLAVREGVAGGLARLRRPWRRMRWRMQPRFTRLELAPEDLRRADSLRAADLMDSIFDFAGVAVDCSGRSPFAVVPPSPEWERELNAFAWLRDLSAADPDAAPERARVLLAEWTRYGATRPIAQASAVTARRLTALVRDAPLMLARATASQHDRLLAVIEDDARRLAERLGEGRLDAERVVRAATVAETILAIAADRDRAHPYLAALDRDLALLVLSDGTTADRNPATLVALLAALLPLRQILAERGVAASRTLMGALDRMMPMLRFFRHSDGALALFNGAGPVDPELVAAIFLLDDSRARPPGQAHYGGYQRLEAGRTVLLVDTGGPPPPALSARHHAAPLALELSSGRNRLVVSTGSGADVDPAWRVITRETAAHSTVTVAETSIADMLGDGALGRRLGPLIASPPWSVTVARHEHQGMSAVVAAHDGYLARFGLMHERTLRLSPRGDRLDGRDRLFAPARRRPARAEAALRFHAHPDVKLIRLESGAVQLLAGDGEAWEFHVRGGEARIEPSIFLGDPGPPRQNDQIVVDAPAPGELRWVFLRSAEPRALRRGPLAAPEPTPLLT
jgi:uncharacterized heparinase superfamily protein